MWRGEVSRSYLLAASPCESRLQIRVNKTQRVDGMIQKAVVLAALGRDRLKRLHGETAVAGAIDGAAMPDSREQARSWSDRRNAGRILEPTSFGGCSTAT